MTGEAEAADARRNDPIRLATPRIDDVEARRARASVESRLFPGSTEPMRVGRYRILGRIGQGGMGVVYRAHDPELARDVAVKLMNAESLDDTETATARTRLVREARAMARLAHPNVIHVYDVGAVEDGVFIAMELVEGESLASWVARAPRDWRDVLRHYVDAGRGLAAAHAAGVIHRDFKPENVLVGVDGRVRVGDFGLAGAPALAGTPALDDVRSSDAALDREIVSGTLTRTGALLGTPKYMAPEQEHGVVASDAGDQFSFCVALYEGLFGEPPFEGETFAKYRKHVRDGEVRPTLADTKVPKWLRDEIVRGLAVAPTARHRSMDALLDALARALVDPRAAQRSWTRVLLVGVPVVVAAVAVGLWVGKQREADAEPVAIAEPTSPVPAEPETNVVPVRAEVPVAYPDTKIAEAKAAETEGAETGAAEPGAAEPAAATPTKPAPPKAAASRSGAAEHGTRKRGICYMVEDENKLIARQASSRRKPFIADKDGTCWSCSGKPAPSLAGNLNPSDCVHWMCSKADPSSCPD